MGFGDAVVGAIKNALGLDEGGVATPGWQKRLKEAAYTGPEGTRIVFQYVDLKRSINLRNRIFRFNGINGKFIQSNGHDEGDYPIVAFFTGDDQDRLGTAFEGLCTEPGRGKLEHPMYGTFDVVPTGTVERENLMVGAANQTAIMVTFSTTLADVYPEFGAVPKNTITQTLGDWDVASAAEFAGTVDLNDPIGQALMGNSVGKALTKGAQTIRKTSGALASAQRAYDNQARKISESIDTLVTAPANLAGQMIELIKSPANTALDLESKLSGYAFFSKSLADDFGKAKNSNDVALNNLLMTCATNASVQSANEQDFSDRPTALETAKSINALNEANSAALDELFVNTDFADIGATYQINQKAVAELTGKLVSDSFNLLTERVIYLDRSRSPIDVCSEVYQDVSEETLQRFLNNNLIGGDEFYLLERGRRISYYA